MSGDRKFGCESMSNEGKCRENWDNFQLDMQNRVSWVLNSDDIRCVDFDVDFKGTENALDRSQNWEFPKEFLFDWRSFILDRSVFSPIDFKWSSIYIEHLPLNENDDFLDMGCGCGVIWITALWKYNLNSVVCADINICAVRNTIKNVSLHKVSKQVDVVQSDVFSVSDSDMPIDKKFDLIFWNAPYFDWDFDENNILYRSMYDKNYDHIKRFILDWQNYLKEWGRIMLWFSSDKFPLEYARKLINQIWYDLKIFYQEVDSLWYSQEILEVVKK